MKKFFRFIFYTCIFGFIFTIFAIWAIILHYSVGLPSIRQLKDYSPNVTSRLYSSDGILLKEYAEEKRLFVKSEDIPDLLKQAFISAEDSNFYKHKGIDPKAILSAVGYNVKAFLNKTQMRGASTITQQVAKNFLLTNERSIERKIKEAILSYRITKTFSKEKVLELYLNQIFLGYKSYGVASAALNYFNKSLDDLTLEECALLAAMPKAPGKLNPKTNYEEALARRNYVLKRMYEERYITKSQLEKAQNTKIELEEKKEGEYFVAGAFTEDVRKKLVELYGEERLLKDGLVITTTLQPKIQKVMQEKFIAGIEEYDRRYGYRGAMDNIFENNKDDFENNWFVKLKDLKLNFYYRKGWKRAVILDILDDRFIIGLLYNDDEEKNDFTEYLEKDGINYEKSVILFKNTKWATKTFGMQLSDNPLMTQEEYIQDAKTIDQVNLKKGDVIYVEKSINSYLLRQTPEANGGAIMIDVNTGKILGMVGGYIDSETTFNRATQANRQLGSIMKPLIYLAAFENGYTPADMIMDQEIILNQGYGLPPYIPKNFTEKFYGLVTLRFALQNSLNVSSVRLVSEMGLDKMTEIVQRFNIIKNPPALYSLVLGSVESKLINITKAYGSFVNGGKEIDSYLIEKVQDKYGKTIYKRDKRECKYCIVEDNAENIDDIIIPELKDERKQITNPAYAYQITSILEGVVKNGTAWRAKAINNTIGGKTGTSNDYRDAWFIGFSPNIVLGIFVGYDNNKSLGYMETGSRAALPIFVSTMKEVMKDVPATPFRVPNSIEFIKIDKTTGEKPTIISEPKNIIFEAFKKKEVINDSLINEENQEKTEENDDKIEENDNENDDIQNLIEESKEKNKAIHEGFKIIEENNNKYLKSLEDKNKEEESNKEELENEDLFENVDYIDDLFENGTL